MEDNYKNSRKEIKTLTSDLLDAAEKIKDLKTDKERLQFELQQLMKQKDKFENKNNELQNIVLGQQQRLIELEQIEEFVQTHANTQQKL